MGDEDQKCTKHGEAIVELRTKQDHNEKAIGRAHKRLDLVESAQGTVIRTTTATETKVDMIHEEIKAGKGFMRQVLLKYGPLVALAAAAWWVGQQSGVVV